MVVIYCYGQDSTLKTEIWILTFGLNLKCDQVITMSAGSPDGGVIPVRVAVRIRPLSEKEIGDGCEKALDKPLPGRPQVVLRNCDKAFTYDFAYNSFTEQPQVFTEAVKPLVDKLFKGNLALHLN